MEDSKKKKELLEKLAKMTKEDASLGHDRDRKSEILTRLTRMEELEKTGAQEQSQQAKKDLWKKLAEQSKTRKT